MTHCPDCKHCEIIDHPKYRWHLQVFCTLKNEGFDEDNKAPSVCREYLEYRISTRAKYLLTHKTIVVKVADEHGFLHDEIVWVPESFEMNLVEER